MDKFFSLSAKMKNKQTASIAKIHIYMYSQADDVKYYSTTILNIPNIKNNA